MSATTFNTYYAGELVRISAVFANVANEPEDPTTVTVSLSDAAETETTLSPVKDSTGHYHVDIDTTDGVEGMWYCLWTGDAPLQVVAKDNFYVRATGF